MGSALPEEIPGHPVDEAQQLKEEIERTREHLGETVNQLVAHVDVKSRAQAKATELTGRAKDAAANVTAKTGTATWILAAGAVTLAVAALVIWQRRKR
jgi:LPXTG-motif cell wall-anchored protein